MGENTKTRETHGSADELREQIRHTESDITETVEAIEERLSPRYLRERGLRNVKRLGWEGVAKGLDLAKRTPVQLSLVGVGALLMVMKNRKLRKLYQTKKATHGSPGRIL